MWTSPASVIINNLGFTCLDLFSHFYWRESFTSLLNWSIFFYSFTTQKHSKTKPSYSGSANTWMLTTFVLHALWSLIRGNLELLFWVYQQTSGKLFAICLKCKCIPQKNKGMEIGNEQGNSDREWVGMRFVLLSPLFHHQFWPWFRNNP